MQPYGFTTHFQKMSLRILVTKWLTRFEVGILGIEILAKGGPELFD